MSRLSGTPVAHRTRGLALPTRDLPLRNQHVPHGDLEPLEHARRDALAVLEEALAGEAIVQHEIPADAAAKMVVAGVAR